MGKEVIYETKSIYYCRGCANRTSAHYGQWCGALIEHDGWEIKDDYPHFN